MSTRSARPLPVRIDLAAPAARLLLALLVFTPAPAAAQASAYRSGDHSTVALNILPPGQGRYMNAPELAQNQADGTAPGNNTDQRALYDLLVQAAPALTSNDLPEFFKDASFGVRNEDVVRRYSPRAGVEVLRDRWGVPHVYGVTRSDTLFGAGYVTGEDRLFMVDVLRHMARGRMTELLGSSPANIQSDRATRFFADYDEAELTAMGDRLETIDPVLGARARQDLTDFTAGLNQLIAEVRIDATRRPGEYDALQIALKDWKLTDSIALTALIGSQFSLGGGGQLANAAFLSALEGQGYPVSEARQIFEDFRRANDPESPTSTEQAFPLNAAMPPADPAAVARPDAAGATAAAMAQQWQLPDHFDTPAGPIPVPLRRGPASNALLVDAAHSTVGRPIAVFGPQVGYYSPQILMEIDLHGPGIAARGAAFPGLSLYVLLGRGDGYAWSATTAYADHLDIRAVKLCNLDSTPATEASISYLNDGVCTPMYRRTDTWLAKPSAGGIPQDPSSLVMSMTTERTRHGIVQSRGTVGGEWVAFVLQRSSYMAEVDSALAFVEVSDPGRIDSVADLQRAFSRFNFAFNWHLLDDKDMGFYTTGAYPVLADGVDPDLPFWGDSRWDPVRYASFEEHPQSINSPKGYIVNWNNKQAPLWRAPDDTFAFGSIQRVQLLDDGVRAVMQDDGKVSVTELVQAMELAATQDIRAVRILRTMLDAMDTPGDAATAAAAALLDAWERAGGHRRDLDLDGEYEHQAAIALLDAWWSRALRRVFEPVLGAAFDAVPLGHDSGANPGGSAYWGGWYGQLDKDLRTILGRSVQGPFSRAYCGAGNAAACSAALQESLAETVSALTDAYGSDPAGWQVEEAAEQIQFSAVGLAAVEPMQWQNRPTFQQVLVFGGSGSIACPLQPQGDCADIAPGISRLTIRSNGAGDRSLLWRVTKGPAIAVTDFGNPSADSDHAFCLYDVDATLLSQATIEAGGNCGGRPCWRPSSRGFRYVDRSGAAGGITRMSLISGEEGTSRLQIAGDGAGVAAPALPLAQERLPLTAQLLNTEGRCWQSRYPDLRRNRDGVLSAVDDAASPAP
ncbi:MAG TPA: penicillin acylase family protein [Candidatus Binatia bacterium]|nr:penicillin acylase family protein [Candidatus Binatia bacterium]